MPARSSRNTPIGPIDGIRRTPRQPAASVKAGPIPVKTTRRRAPEERPLPTPIARNRGRGLSFTQPGPHQPLSNDVVSHPSLPVQRAQPSARTSHKSSVLRQVIGRAFRTPHDKRSTSAILIATLISPTFWVFLAAPWLITAILQPGSTGSRAVIAASQRLLGVSFVGLSGRLLLLSLGLFLIWVGRHALLLVSHAVHVRQIDHRLSDTYAFWWSAVHKLTRSFTLAVFDAIFTGAVVAGITMVVLWISRHHVSPNLFYQGLALNAVLVFAALIAIILAVHRPLARVMLATTDLTPWQLMKYSFGMIVYNFGRTLLMGVWWVIIGAVTMGLLLGIGWATLSYGTSASNHALIATLLLGTLSAVLTYGVLAVFLLWSQGYWSLAYHYLAHRTYPAQVSRFFTTTPHTSRRRISLARVGLVTLAFGILITVGLLASRGVLERGWQRLQSYQPSIQTWLEQR